MHPFFWVTYEFSEPTPRVEGIVNTTKKNNKKETSNCYRKKNGVCCGYGGTHTPEHHPVEIIYTLLFCRYAKTLPQPLGRLHLKRSRTGAVILRPLFVQHHLLDRWSACSTSSSSTASHSSSPEEECARNTDDELSSITPCASAPPSKAPGCYVGFENRAEFPTAHLVLFLSNSLFCCCFQHTFLQPL